MSAAFKHDQKLCRKLTCPPASYPPCGTTVNDEDTSDVVGGFGPTAGRRSAAGSQRGEQWAGSRHTEEWMRIRREEEVNHKDQFCRPSALTSSCFRRHHRGEKMGFRHAPPAGMFAIWDSEIFPSFPRLKWSRPHSQSQTYICSLQDAIREYKVWGIPQ